jgi:hypothetical protein
MRRFYFSLAQKVRGRVVLFYDSWIEVNLRYLKVDENPTPTTALEYTFARKSRAMSPLKDVAHIWELGKKQLIMTGGADSLIDLINVPIKQGKMNSFIMCFDLSRPHTWINLIDVVLENVRQYTQKLVGSDLQNTLVSFWKEHPDR